MKAIFENSSELEKRVKEKYHFPQYVMMENASSSMEIVLNSVLEDYGYGNTPNGTKAQVLIVCGKGNNGADGLALARRIHSKYEVFVYLCGNDMKTDEGKTQLDMARQIGVDFISEDEFEKLLLSSRMKIIVDCIFGTGFHGELPEKIAYLINLMNDAQGVKIACDIPSGLAFKADFTVTMGTLKTSLFSDKAKAVCGEIFIADLGIGHEDFEKCAVPEAFLIENSDISLPFRKQKDAHKGSFGHAVVVSGEKSGAAILASEASVAFGSGLTTIVKSENSNLEQFKISPVLMISDTLPKKTTALLLGCGLGRSEENYEKAENIIEEYVSLCNAEKKDVSLVLDADMMYYPNIKELLTRLNKIENAKVVLTPHLKELSSLVHLCGLGEISVSELNSIEERIRIGKAFSDLFPKTAIIMKSANTLICEGKSYAFFVCADGKASLAKGGSGDVLAGLVLSLLAQGYDIKNACITATEMHALSSQQGDEFYLTAEDLRKNIESIARH